MLGASRFSTVFKRFGWRKWAHTYKWDFLSIAILCFAVLLFVWPLWSPGYIVFSDLDFGISSKRYLNEIFGVWNERWSTPTLLNIARLPWILGPWLISGLFGWSGAVFLKSFITALLMVSAGSMYWLCKRITSVYFSRHFDAITILGLITGALFYALNPWVVFRIQHVFLLCGYSLMPLCLLFFFNAFDPRFQRQFIDGYEASQTKIYRRHIFDLFCFALTFSVSAGAIHYFFYGVIFYSGIGMLLFFNTLRQERGLSAWWGVCRVTLKKLFITTTLFGCFSFFWLGCYFGSIIKHAQVSQHNVNVVDTLSLFSRNSQPIYVLYLLSYWWPMFDLHSLPVSFWLGGGVLFFVIGFAILVRSWKHPILLLFTLLALLFALMGTGVQTEAFADKFVKIVTKTPVVGPIFRDPNKAVGLLAISFSILLNFGTQLIIRYAAPPRGKRWMQFSLFGAITVGLYFYLAPLRHPFIDGFYHPVQVAPEYFRIQNQTVNPTKFDSRLLYLPIADNMTQPETGIATPRWNQNPLSGGELKATGDFQVYSAQKNALFHHEGNSPNVGYYMNFLQDLLDKGRTQHLGRLLGPLGIDELAYHNEYLGQEKRQRFNLDLLKLQKDLIDHGHDGIFSFYENKLVLPYMGVVPRRVFTPYGLTSLESYSAFPNFNFRENGVVFSGWENKGGLSTAQSGDLIETRTLDDLALATLERDDYLLPFDGVEDGDAFLKWSKTLFSNPDWEWSLRSQDLQGFSYETDLNAGVALTFASRRLNLRPYQMARAQKSAPIVVNFDQALRDDKMFVADAPEKVAVQTYPGNIFNRLPLIHGQVTRDDPRNIWQVAKSGYFAAQPNTPYQFRVLASGRGTNKLHIKARFLDGQKQEIGVQYIVAPAEKIDFDAVNLYGECISPPNTRFMRLDLLTFPRKEAKVYWWIHDIEIRSLAKWAVPNVIRQTKKFKASTKVHLFARILLSPRGGMLRFGFGARNFFVYSKHQTLTQFIWKDLGILNFPAGETTVETENLAGFNAVNILAIVPIEHLKQAREQVRQLAQNGRVFCTFQAETDFVRDGPLQSERFYPRLNLGRGFACQKGTLSREIEIIKPAQYTSALWLSVGGGTGQIEVVLRNMKGETKRRVWQAKQSAAVKEWVVEPDPLHEKFPLQLLHLPNVLNGYQRVDLPLGYLSAGKYQLSIRMNSRVPEMTKLESLRPFNFREIVVPKGGLREDDATCANCVSITPDMMQRRMQQNVLRIACQPTCSCDWYINSTNLLPADEQSEYLISFSARSEFVRKRHTKIFCLDANRRPLKTVFINEVEDKDQNRWNDYQQIILTPKGTKFLQWHVWARGGEKNVGTIEIKNFSLLPMKKFLSLDLFALVEGTNAADLFQKPKAWPAIKFTRVDTMKRTFTVQGTGEKMIRFAESPSPLWEMQLGKTRKRADVAINGVSNAFSTSDMGSGMVQTVLRNWYYGGLILFLVGFALGVIMWLKSVPHAAPDD